MTDQTTPTRSCPLCSPVGSDAQYAGAPAAPYDTRTCPECHGTGRVTDHAAVLHPELAGVPYRWERPLKRTKTTGQTCVGDLRLSPLDVGFDLRLHDYAVQIPESFGSVGLDIDGETYLIEGTRDEMIAAIREAGYKVEDTMSTHTRRGVKIAYATPKNSGALYDVTYQGGAELDMDVPWSYLQRLARDGYRVEVSATTMDPSVTLTPARPNPYV